VALTLVLLGVLYAAVILGAVKWTRRTHPVTVMSHLQKKGPYTVKVGPFTNAWTPERPASIGRLPMGFYQMPGRGSLLYSIESDGETVHLRWQSKRGSFREWVGPIPTVAKSDFKSRNRRGILLGLAVFVVLAVVGTGLGLLGGSIITGLVVGLVAGYFFGVGLWSANVLRAFQISYRELTAPS
jgi:hypothetical protein